VIDIRKSDFLFTSIKTSAGGAEGCPSLWIGDEPKDIRWIRVIRNDLGAAHTCRLALLPPPSTVRAQRAGGENFNHRWQQFDDAGNETAVGAIEVPAAAARARRRNPEYFRRRHRASDSQHLFCHLHGLGEVTQERPLICLADHAEHDAAFHARFGTRTKR
jgi:hypothetical protein